MTPLAGGRHRRPCWLGRRRLLSQWRLSLQQLPRERVRAAGPLASVQTGVAAHPATNCFLSGWRYWIDWIGEGWPKGAFRSISEMRPSTWQSRSRLKICDRYDSFAYSQFLSF